MKRYKAIGFRAHLPDNRQHQGIITFTQIDFCEVAVKRRTCGTNEEAEKKVKQYKRTIRTAIEDVQLFFAKRQTTVALSQEESN